MLQPGVERAARSSRWAGQVPSSEFRVPTSDPTRNSERGTRNPYAEAGDGLSGLEEGVGDLDLGLRSRTRFSPGCNRTGLQPSKPDNHKGRPGGTLRFLIRPKLAKNQLNRDFCRDLTSTPIPAFRAATRNSSV